MTDVTFQAMYLMVGAERAIREYGIDVKCHLDMAQALADRAPILARCRRNLVCRLGDLPGVFEYEVTEEMGSWQVRHPNSSVPAFKAQLQHEVTVFKEQK